jgi:hypothetical protein
MLLDGLPLGFLVGAIAGLVLSLLGVWSAGWNAHVDHIEREAVKKATDTAERERR